MVARLEEMDNDGEEGTVAFPRLADDLSISRDRSDSEVLLRVYQRRTGDSQSSFEVLTSPEGRPEIPMSVSATTVGSWLPKAVLLRSPWLTRCLQASEGAVITRSLGGCDLEEPDGECEGEEGLGSGSGAVVACRRVACSVLEINLPARGAGQLLLSPRGVLQCLDLCTAHRASSSSEVAAAVPASQLFAVFLWASVLELRGLAESCREAIVQSIDVTTVALALATGHAAGDVGLLRHCYWCLRETVCGVNGTPSSWLNGQGPVKLARGVLSYGTVCRTPLRILADILEEDLATKRAQWLTPTDCYTLCQVHRQRQPSGAYPHRYELRLDHSDEVLLTAFREDERSMCRIFEHGAAGPSSSEHCKAFLGAVIPNFWGTEFSLYDSGSDLDTLTRRFPPAADLPLRQRSPLCKIVYETNILGDCPRKVTMDFERAGTQHHMQNVAPRWDKKLNSYALPFFGRVKKASAKNFQLVVNDDLNTIFLMFGKISKDVFCLDFRGPLAPLDAMAIAIAALAKKRAVS